MLVVPLTTNLDYEQLVVLFEEVLLQCSEGKISYELICQYDRDKLTWLDKFCDKAKRRYILPALGEVLPAELLYRLDFEPKFEAERDEVLSEFKMRALPQSITGTQLVGIINVTPNSFSDGSLFDEAEQALAQAKHLIASGAHCLDIGAESTRPHVNLIDDEIEWQRLEPVLKNLQDYLRAQDIEFIPEISLDTRHANIVERALDYAIDWVNDVDGSEFHEIVSLLTGTKVKYITMHNLGIPPSGKVLPDSLAPIDYLLQWGEQRKQQLLASGLKLEQIIFDPGIGFGTSPAHVRDILHHTNRLQELSLPVLVGHSRKSFMSSFTDVPAPQRDLETAILSVKLSQQGVDYLRVHNMDATRRALKAEKWLG